ncbi:hypothetical protein TrLO_g1383 [Triparma laevis f. longispina]|uniref:Uncharacterized protein n=1 Tax=Triparma laevis f. longispina TaxID=1714387 RepID=A0A9W7FTT7_9STRA|nr:hypothetical protein TrLO_g1383 [Triparma laevis f. longispina]
MPGSTIYERHANRHILLKRTYPNHVVSSVPANWYEKDLNAQASASSTNSGTAPSPQPLSAVNALLLVAGSLYIAKSAAAKSPTPGAARDSGLAFATNGRTDTSGVTKKIARPVAIANPVTMRFSGSPVGRVGGLLGGGKNFANSPALAINLSKVAGRSLAGASGLVVFGLAKAFL